MARTTLSSKIFGRESDFFANMAVDAMAMVKDVDPESGKVQCTALDPLYNPLQTPRAARYSAPP